MYIYIDYVYIFNYMQPYILLVTMITFVGFAYFKPYKRRSVSYIELAVSAIFIIMVLFVLDYRFIQKYDHETASLNYSVNAFLTVFLFYFPFGIPAAVALLWFSLLLRYHSLL